MGYPEPVRSGMLVAGLFEHWECHCVAASLADCLLPEGQSRTLRFEMCHLPAAAAACAQTPEEWKMQVHCHWRLEAHPILVAWALDSPEPANPPPEVAQQAATQLGRVAMKS